MADPAVAPPPWKATWFINHAGSSSGWSEIHYINTASLGAAQTALAILLSSRMSILTSKYSLVYARLSDMQFKGDGYVTTANLPIPGVFVPGTPDGGKPGDCMLLRLIDGQGRHLIRELRGVPEESITDGILTATAPYTTAANAYFTLLIANTAFRRKKAVAPFVEFVPITGINAIRSKVKKAGRPFGLSRGRAVIH